MGWGFVIWKNLPTHWSSTGNWTELQPAPSQTAPRGLSRHAEGGKGRCSSTGPASWADQQAGEDLGATVSPLIPAGAWILTSALRVGLARYVGQAVRDHSLASTSTKARVVAIGIASLGHVLHRQLLDDAQVSVWLGALRPQGKAVSKTDHIPPSVDPSLFGKHLLSPSMGQAGSGQTSPCP